MTTNEFRIGNIINYAGNPVQVLEIFRDKKLELGYFCDSIGFTRSLDDDLYLKKIPLTTDWLIRGGCEKVNNSTYRMGTFTFQNVIMPESNDGDVVERIFNSKKGFRVCMQGRFIRNIFWVHDWQNFHFGISKQELNFIK